MEIKRCNTCGRFLGEDQFRVSGKYTLPKCKKCERSYRKVYYTQNRDKEQAGVKKYYSENREEWLAYNKQYQQDNKDKVYKQQKAARDRNKGHYNYNWSLTRARKYNALSLDANLNKIESYYKIAHHMGKGWHVDHIIPYAKGGLHHEDNLQIITAEENMSKGSKLGYEPLVYFRL